MLDVQMVSSAVVMYFHTHVEIQDCHGRDPVNVVTPNWTGMNGLASGVAPPAPPVSVTTRTMEMFTVHLHQSRIVRRILVMLQELITMELFV